MEDKTTNIGFPFPLRCVTCNEVIAGKWEAYIARVKEYRKTMNQGNEIQKLTTTTVKTAEGKALDDLEITSMCCRRHFLTYV